MALNIIIFTIFISIIYGDDLLIDREQLRQSLKNTENPICGCYNISVTNISLSPINNNEMCYTYSIQYNDNEICVNNEAIHILFGICTHERPKFTSRKLRKSLQSIHPNNYNAKSLKLHRSSMLGIKIQNDINIFNTNEEITLCMKNINSEGFTSKNMQYILNNGDVVSCKNHENHDGLPCVTTQQQPTSKPTPAPTEDDAPHSTTLQTTSIHHKPTQSPTATPANTNYPTKTPTNTNYPSKTPTKAPTNTPTNIPTNTLTIAPTKTPTNVVTKAPVNIVTSALPNAPINSASGPVTTATEYDICVDKFSLIQDIELTIKKHVLLNEMMIEIIGPSDKWFAFGFGQNIMHNSYSITMENSEFNVFEYMLPDSNNGFSISSNKYDISTWNVNDIQTNELNGKRTITIKRAYNVENTYDFTSYFQCNMNSIPIISAIGNGLNIGYHKQRTVGTITTNACDCTHSNPTSTTAIVTTATPPITSDICIIFDQSCNLDANECRTYKYWISEFLISLETDNNTRNINKRICLLAISDGVQILIKLNEVNDIITIAQLIKEQSCGDSSTNLYDALEIAELEFNTIIPNGNIKSLIIFSNCASTNAQGEENENVICNTYNNMNIHNNINMYVINIQSINGLLAGNKSNINDIYLNCLINNNNNRMVSIDQHNLEGAQWEIETISNEIILSEEQYNVDDINEVNDAKAAFNNVLDTHELEEESVNVYSNYSKRNIAKWLFILVMIVIASNALCFTFCALRQSGSLDTCFGKIDRHSIFIDISDIDNLNIDDSLSDILSDSSIIINQ